MNASEPREDAVAVSKMHNWRERLEWAVEAHITREYRTVTFGEYEAREMLAALAQQGAEPVAAPKEAGDTPLKVFSEGAWLYEEPGQRFSAADLDAAAFVEYRRLAAPSKEAGPLDELTREQERLGLYAAPQADQQGETHVFNCRRCPVSVESRWLEPECPECGDPCELDASAKQAAKPSDQQGASLEGDALRQIVREMRNEAEGADPHHNVSPKSVLYWAERIAALASKASPDDQWQEVSTPPGDAVAWACWSSAGLHRLCADESTARMQAFGHEWHVIPLYTTPQPAADEPCVRHACKRVRMEMQARIDELSEVDDVMVERACTAIDAFNRRDMADNTPDDSW